MKLLNTILIAGYVMLFTTSIQNVYGAEQSTKRQRWPLTAILPEISHVTGLKFTLELCDDKGKVSEPEVDYEIHDVPQDPAGAVNYLKQLTPKFEIVAGSFSEGVFHIIDKRIYKDVNYALNKTIDHFEYSGNPISLLGELSKQGFPLLLDTSGPVLPNTPFVVDGSTLVSIHNLTAPVRDVLTIGLPKDYSPILWIAKSRTNGALVSTSVSFKKSLP